MQEMIYYLYMTHRLHIFFYTLLILALLAMTGVAAFLFGRLQNQTPPDTTLNTNSPLINQNIQPKTSNPLADHDTWITFSDDPTTFEEGKLVLESASVPDVLVCDPTIQTPICSPDEILIYYVDAATLIGPGSEQLGLIRSSDGGETWGEAEHISLTGKTNQGAAVDPSVVLLSDGRVRLYYFGSETTQGDPASAPGDHVIYSAISSDGVNFVQEEGERLALERMTDPEVVEWNGSWYMLYSVGPNSGLAVGSDGLTFVDQGIISPSFGGVPGLLADDSRLIGYGCQQGISSSISTDGQTFTKNSTPALQLDSGILCDPAVDVYQDKYVMVYKTAPAQSGNKPIEPKNTQNGTFQNQNIPPLQE